MARYLARSCPRCKGYVGIVIREPGRNVPLQAVNGRCTNCSYRMAWVVIRGKMSATEHHFKKDALR
jgi:C4-type Zn-finger protein